MCVTFSMLFSFGTLPHPYTPPRARSYIHPYSHTYRPEYHMQTSKLADTQTYRLTYRNRRTFVHVNTYLQPAYVSSHAQTCRHAYVPPYDIQTYRHANTPTYRDTDMPTYRHTRHTDIRNYRGADIQTYGHKQIPTTVHLVWVCTLRLSCTTFIHSILSLQLAPCRTYAYQNAQSAYEHTCVPTDIQTCR